jgi:hypothetical protein
MLEHTVSAASPAPAEETARAAQEPLHAVELTSDCLALFASKVQPILLNTCASCHAAGKGGPFVLSRGGDAGLQRTTQVNLAATVRQIAFDRPAASPLLQKACTIHGGAAVPPLAGPQAVPFGMLQEWVGLVIARNPQLKPQGAASAHTNPDTDKITEAPALSPFQAAAATAANTPVSEPPQPRTVPVEASVAGLTAPRSVGIELSPASPAAPARPLTADPASAENASPYDVKEFNTQWHPQSSGR